MLSLKVCHTNRLQVLRRGLAPAPAAHQRLRTGIAQFHSARDIPPISPAGTLSILMPTYNKEAAGTYLLPLMRIWNTTRKTFPGSLSQCSETGALSFLGCGWYLFALNFRRGWGHGGSGWEWRSLA